MKYKHVVWDWNGTLLDDGLLCVEVLNELLKKRCMKEITFEQYQAFFEFPVESYYKKLGFDFNKESFEEISTEFILNYNKKCHGCELQPNAKRVLDAISKTNISQSILSAMKQKNLVNLVENNGLSKYFTDIIGLDNHHAKSKVEIGKQWITMSAFKNSEILYVGDTIHDHEVARTLEVDCVLIPSGHQSKERLERREVPIISSLNEVLNFL
ncbi:MAG: HAD family hydrolase [Promethearchaeota archaeon]